MTAELYRDVPDCLTEMARAGIKTYIYSSGSREAQRLFFGHTQVRKAEGEQGFSLLTLPALLASGT